MLPKTCIVIRIGREISVEELYVLTLTFIDEPSSKRFEENIKFIFKLTLKRLKNNLAKRNKIACYSKSFDIQFYNYYFLELALSRGVEINKFYDPLNTKTGAKTLNNDYLKLLFSSALFYEDFNGYINTNDIYQDYQQTLQRKLRQLLLKFDHLFNSNNEVVMRTSLSKVQNYFRKNRQCKLPWLESEVKSAVEVVNFMINNQLF